MTTTTIHDDFDAWAATALTEGLSAEERIAFSSHLAACAQCRALYQKTEAMNESLNRTFALERPAPGFEHKLVAAFRKGKRGSWLAEIPATIVWLVRLRAVQTAGVLAALVLLVALGNQMTRPSGMLFSNSRSSGVNYRRDESLAADKNAPAAGPVSSTANGEDLGFRGGAKVFPDAADQEKNLADTKSDSDGKTRDFAATGHAMTIGGGQITLGKAKGKNQDAGTFSLAPAVTTAPLVVASGKMLSDKEPSVFGNMTSATEQIPAEAPAPLTAPNDARKLIRNANVELEVASFESALDKLATTATQSGGYIATKNSARGANGKLRGTIIVKVLPQNLDGFLLELRTLGEVKNQTLASQDVTKEYTDTAAHLRNAQRMEERLLKMLDEAKGKMSEVLQVEKELGRVRESIETMQGEIKLYDSLVSYATVTLSLYEKDLNQPAAFLLRQTGNLELLAADVEKTYADARRIAESVSAQISDANISRDGNGKVSATLQLLIPATATDNTLRQLKTLGRIQNFTSQTERTAQNGSNGDAGTSNAKVDTAPAVFRVTIEHDEATNRQIRFTVFAKDIDQAFDEARKAAAAAGAEVVSSNLVRPRNGAGNATLVVRVAAPKHAEFITTLQKLGRASDYQVQRDAAPESEETGTAPVLVSLQLVDEEPSVQQTRLRIEASDIGNRVQDFKQAATAAGATVRDSTFQRLPDGRETAQILLRFPLTKYAELLGKAQALGKTRELSVNRRDIAAGQATDGTAPAELSVSLGSESKIVADNSGLSATLRRTLSEAIHSLLWSVQMIGVAVAFLAPWIMGTGAAWFIVARLRKLRKNRAALKDTNVR